MTRLRIATLALTGALALAACGSDDASELTAELNGPSTGAAAEVIDSALDQDAEGSVEADDTTEDDTTEDGAAPDGNPDGEGNPTTSSSDTTSAESTGSTGSAENATSDTNSTANNSSTPSSSPDPATPTATTTAPSAEGSVVERFWIGPELVDCHGVVPQKCMQVAKTEGGKFGNFYTQIEGFEFIPGTNYVIDVVIEEIDNPPADGSSLRYTLLEVVETS